MAAAVADTPPPPPPPPPPIRASLISSLDSKSPTRTSLPPPRFSYRPTISSATTLLPTPEVLTFPSSFFRPTLVDLCVPILAKTFINRPTLAQVPPSVRSQIVAKLPLDLPLDLCAKHIPDEDYWKRRANLRWKTCDISAHGRSWRQLYLERHLASALERELFAFKLEFGWRNARMQYDPTRFGMKISDCLSLSSSLSIATTLASLDLSCNLLNDEKVSILVKGMLKTSTLVQLDLSHNRIADAGADELSKLLNSEKCVLGGLNVGDNHISADGAKSFAEALKTNSVLLCLSLRYNRIGDEGGQAIFEALQMNTTLQRLGLGSCELGRETSYALGRLIRTAKSGILYLDISANRLIGADGGTYIQSSLMQESSKSPKHIDLQLCEVGKEIEESIMRTVQRRNEVEAVHSLSKKHSFKV